MNNLILTFSPQTAPVVKLIDDFHYLVTLRKMMKKYKERCKLVIET